MHFNFQGLALEMWLWVIIIVLGPVAIYLNARKSVAPKKSGPYLGLLLAALVALTWFTITNNWNFRGWLDSYMADPFVLFGWGCFIVAAVLLAVKLKTARSTSR